MTRLSPREIGRRPKASQNLPPALQKRSQEVGPPARCNRSHPTATAIRCLRGGSEAWVILQFLLCPPSQALGVRDFKHCAHGYRVQLFARQARARATLMCSIPGRDFLLSEIRLEGIELVVPPSCPTPILSARARRSINRLHPINHAKLAAASAAHAGDADRPAGGRAIVQPFPSWQWKRNAQRNSHRTRRRKCSVRS